MFRSLVRSQEGISPDQEDSDADEVTVPFIQKMIRDTGSVKSILTLGTTDWVIRLYQEQETRLVCHEIFTSFCSGLGRLLYLSRNVDFLRAPVGVCIRIRGWSERMF